MKTLQKFAFATVLDYCIPVSQRIRYFQNQIRERNHEYYRQ
jgi:hypothetical protein